MKQASHPILFNRRHLKNRRERAAKNFMGHAALFEETAEYLHERLQFVKKPFLSICEIGAHHGNLAEKLKTLENNVFATDLSFSMINRLDLNCTPIVADEEMLPFAENSFDLIVSNLSLHHVNDLPGTLIQIKNCLRPGGLFLATLLGGETLIELRSALALAEIELYEGLSPRISPTVDMATASALLQRAGFSLPVTDHDVLTFEYSSFENLLQELKGMGESNILTERQKSLTKKSLFKLAEKFYPKPVQNPQEDHDKPSKIHATFDVITIHGWRD